MANPFSGDNTLLTHYLAPIADYISDESVTSIFVNNYKTVFVVRGGEKIRVPAAWKTEDELQGCIAQIAYQLGQEIDPDRSPILDAKLPDGSRVNAVLYPTSVRGSNVTIRRFPEVPYSLADLHEFGMFNAEMMAYLEATAIVEYATLVGGISGSGKTTVLNAIANKIPPERRVGIVEDTTEMSLQLPNFIQAEAPKKQALQTTVTMATLIKATLRQELDALIVGEVRDAQAAEALMLALTTGCRYVAGTMHANNAHMTIRRFENLLMSGDAGLPYEAVQTDVRTTIRTVAYAERTPLDGKRIVELAEMSPDGLRILWRWDYEKREHVRCYDQMPSIVHDCQRYDPALATKLASIFM